MPRTTRFLQTGSRALQEVEAQLRRGMDEVRDGATADVAALREEHVAATAACVKASRRRPAGGTTSV